MLWREDLIWIEVLAEWLDGYHTTDKKIKRVYFNTDDNIESMLLSIHNSLQADRAFAFDIDDFSAGKSQPFDKARAEFIIQAFCDAISYVITAEDKRDMWSLLNRAVLSRETDFQRFLNRGAGPPEGGEGFYTPLVD